ncbi:MAG TPA: phosphatidylglycerophosphatase A [Rhizomicrobium sp.]|nr:phosphatidylglycerophosphatase A [Rhizomicrobium sp.]
MTLSEQTATLFGIGRAPAAPGTVASLAALPLAWAIKWFTNDWIFLAIIVAVTIIAIRVCEAYARETGVTDPSECVIDELAGQWIACLLAPLSLIGFGLALVLFRAFDIAKPWPIERFERAPGGLGIVLDDVVAGLLAGIIVGVVRLIGLI